MDVSALLAQYLSIKSQVNHDQFQQTKWSNLHEDMSKKVSDQTSYASKYEDAYSDAETKGSDESQELKYGGKTWKAKSTTLSGKALRTACEEYAKAKVPKYNPEKLEEYEALDIEYDMMQSTYDTLLESLTAQEESLKTKLGEGSKDTGAIE